MCFAALQPPAGIYSGEVWQPGHHTQPVQEQVLHVLQEGNSLLAALRPSCRCSLATFAGADLSRSSVPHVEHAPLWQGSCRAAPRSGKWVIPYTRRRTGQTKLFWEVSLAAELRSWTILLQHCTTRKPVCEPTIPNQRWLWQGSWFSLEYSEPKRNRSRNNCSCETWYQRWPGTTAWPSPNRHLGCCCAQGTAFYVRDLSFACTARSFWNDPKLLGEWGAEWRSLRESLQQEEKARDMNSPHCLETEESKFCRAAAALLSSHLLGICLPVPSQERPKALQRNNPLSEGQVVLLAPTFSALLHHRYYFDFSNFSISKVFL